MTGQPMRFIVNSMRGISRILQDANPELRDVFNAIGEDLFDAILEELRTPEEESGESALPEQKEIDVPEILQSISRRRGAWPVPARLGNMPINAIPGGEQKAGQRVCVAKATGKWYEADGFTGVVKQVIDLWNEHPKENQVTLIFTTAWNSEDFAEKFKKKFDSYCSGRHNVTIVYLSNLGFSLQYLK